MAEDKNQRPVREHTVVDKPLETNSMEIPPQPPPPQPPTTTDTNQTGGGDSDGSE